MGYAEAPPPAGLGLGLCRTRARARDAGGHRQGAGATRAFNQQRIIITMAGWDGWDGNLHKALARAG